jgi:hypothetical protein
VLGEVFLDIEEVGDYWNCKKVRNFLGVFGKKFSFGVGQMVIRWVRLSNPTFVGRNYGIFNKEEA